MDYAWAQNKIKLARALQEKPGGSEEEIKELYKSYLGVVLETPEEKAVASMTKEETPDEVPGDVIIDHTEEKPKRRNKRS